MLVALDLQLTIPHSEIIIVLKIERAINVTIIM